MDLDKTKSNAGIHKNFLIERFGERERHILRRLSGWWYLTNSGEEVVLGANARMNFFLMKPTTSFAEGFNLDREIICVFSDYENFEPRTLDAMDSAARTYQNLRVESICRIVVSGDPDVEEKIKDLLKNDPESPIVIPFTYDELDGCDEDFIKNRFRKFFYTRDLFGFLSPLKKDLYFFGRSDLILEQINRHASGEHSGLFGLRKSGKTSVIYAIERRLKSIGSYFVSLDCESPSVHQLRWNELLHRVALLYHRARESKIKAPSVEQYDEKNCADQFWKDMHRIYESKKSSSTMFIFDEIERISPGTGSSVHWRDGDDFVYFWQTMRAFYQRNPQVFTYLLVGTNPKCVESPVLNGHENPLFASVPDSYVPPFDVSKVREMVRKLGRYMGLKFDEQIYTALCDDFGGHPFLIRQFCSELNRQCRGDRPITVRKPLYLAVKKDAQIKIAEYLEMILAVLRDNFADEYDLLRILAADDFEGFNEFANNNPSAVRHLIGYGVILKDQSRYAFNIESIKAHVSNKHKYDRVNLSLEDMRTEISVRRNDLETSLRDLAYKVFVLSLGKSKVKDAVLSSIPSSRREKLSGYTAEALLDAEHSPLFLLDIIELINRNWEMFEKVFEGRKDKVMNALRDINESGRPDCHAKGVTSDDFTQLRLHFRFLESQLSGW
ncbi:ATP-binding protein [Wenzhouxiangella sp. XN24]|uniref:ATP-binding protein n=1 Tax=Wenzhouxiangella sp. XN24 TaxID=2713569 RepID=UPI0013EAB737|nr:ATP-binding protein [Wenzhouxiangella sp. XN24]NGX16028.1 ATP-binding protein [Wenzhouxiangella sp. XN24]